jgi:hypothetical protein
MDAGSSQRQKWLLQMFFWRSKINKKDAEWQEFLKITLVIIMLSDCTVFVLKSINCKCWYFLHVLISSISSWSECDVLLVSFAIVVQYCRCPVPPPARIQDYPTPSGYPPHLPGGVACILFSYKYFYRGIQTHSEWFRYPDPIKIL